MNKKIKKLFSIALSLAITAASAISMSVSAIGTANYNSIYSSEYTILDDKGMLKNGGSINEGYKILYKNGRLYRAEPLFAYARFILSEDVNYEEANERIIEIFKEFYPDNYLGVSMPTTSAEYDEYADNYKPNLWSNTVDGITTYTLCVSDRYVRSLKDEKVAAARKYSKAFAKKLNEEKLISAFYDFGEIYLTVPSDNVMSYWADEDEDINLINNYIKENNIDCTLEKRGEYFYDLKSGDNDIRKEFLIAADIYEVTSIAAEPIYVKEPMGVYLYGKNAIEEISDVTVSKDVKIVGDANGDNEITIRDCLFIARKLAHREATDLPDSADYNKDGKKNIKDAADLAKDIAKRII